MKVQKDLTAKDFIITELLRNIGRPTFIQFPREATADQIAALKNVLMIPGIEVEYSLTVAKLTILPPEEGSR